MKRLILLLAALCLLCGCAGPASDAPANEAPADETPANEAPANEAPTDAPPANEAPTDDAPADEAPAPTDDAAPVLTCGDYVMTSAQFQFFFGHQFGAIIDAYGDSAFDPSKDLTAQRYDENQSWAEFLSDQALTLAEQTELLCLAAKDAGFAPIEGEIPTDEQAKSQGYADVTAMLAALYGEGARPEYYQAFARDMATSAAYSAQLSAAVYSDAELEAYYDSHAADYETVFSLPKDDARAMDVRVIRFYPDDTGKDTDWADAEQRARKVEAEYQKAPSDEAFAALAEKYSEDFNAPDGGLYTGLHPGGTGAMYDWLYSGGDRAAGDTTLLRENGAWALCCVSAVEDRPYWMRVVEQDLRRDDYINTLDALRKTYVFERHPEHIDLRVPTAHTAKERYEGVEAVG